MNKAKAIIIMTYLKEKVFRLSRIKNEIKIFYFSKFNKIFLM
jgi:hypothetical protein